MDGDLIMANQEENNTNSVVPLGKHQVNDSHQIHTVSYYSSNAVASLTTQGENHSLRVNGVLSNSTYNHDKLVESSLKNVQDRINLAPIVSTSSSGPANVAQGHSGFAPYPYTDPSGYNSTSHAAYYSHYQQQSNPYQHRTDQFQQQSDQYQQKSNQYQQQSNQYQQQSNHYQHQSNQPYSNQVGAYQNTGAAYQPLSSFQSTGSYAGPASYPSTYYNPGYYQTSGSYTSSSYGTQTNFWHGGQFATGSSHQCQNYTADLSPAYGSNTAGTTSQYQQNYKQWADYYNKTQTEVTCAPGTENISVSIASGTNSFFLSGSSAHAASNKQVPATYTASRMAESISSELTPVQPVATSDGKHEACWKNGAHALQNDLSNSVLPHTPKPPEIIPAYESSQNHHSSMIPQGPTASYPTSYQVSQSYHSSFQTVSQPLETLDSRRTSKLQIPTNPRIVSNLPFGISKPDKDASMIGRAAKPAYVSISMQKSNEEADAALKPGVFPNSLHGYVERALARCKNDGQKAACQAIMKEVIQEATSDGTLHTRDWDTEPLFPLPNTDAVINQDTSSAIPKNRSPSRRAKSRWEPIPEEKLVEKPPSVSVSIERANYSAWNNKMAGRKLRYPKSKFSLSDQGYFSKNVLRPAKRQRLGDGLNAAGGAETSSDSDTEQNLMRYHPAAIALADSPEEKKRRENRFKRFDRGHGRQIGKHTLRLRDVGAGNLYGRQAAAMVLSRTSEESGGRAVEDIDWDALTVKGTCQEVEKRYLRLTSAPDPAMVRPEEVLEKALLMVKNSQKNYLYKCDQLKSIRQDLTVQHIQNELTVKVYEAHARLAIEAGDLAEYNQCQSQLKTLYAEGIAGCCMEFAAYNLLCVILHSNNNRDLLSAMSRLSADAKKDKAVKHALSVRSAVTSGNYIMFFRLYKSAPNLNTCLMDLYVEKMRYAAVKCMSRSYRPTVPVSYLSQILGFSSTSLPASDANDEKEVNGLEECAEWLKAHRACLILDNSGRTMVDTKASISTLYMPEPEDAVSHGDASLDVNDFLTGSLA